MKEKVKVMLHNGAVREFDQGTTIEQVAKSISASLLKNAVAGKINGQTVDLNRPVENDCQLDQIGKEIREKKS